MEYASTQINKNEREQVNQQPHYIRIYYHAHLRV